MKVIPVLDILDGVAVRAQGGVRNEYQPLRSLECESSNPLEIARCIRNRFGYEQWYVADLDGIVHRQWNTELIGELIDHGFSLLIDAGIQQIEDLFELQGYLENSRIVLASETLADCSMLDTLTGMFHPDRLIFSLDLINGEIICPESAWGCCTIPEVIDYVYQRGLREMIVLDLAYIGCTKGVGTIDVCRQLKENFPDLIISTGGGVRTTEQLQLIKQTGLDGVLMGTAIHNGQLSPTQMHTF